MITPKCRLPDVAVQLLPPEVEEFFETGSQVSLPGISEWTNVITQKCRLPDVAVHLLPPEVEEFFETGSQVSLLGISEWTNVITPNCCLPDFALQLLPPEVEEFLETGSQVKNESSLMVCFESAMCDLVHDVQVCKHSTVSGSLF